VQIDNALSRVLRPLKMVLRPRLTAPSVTLYVTGRVRGEGEGGRGGRRRRLFERVDRSRSIHEACTLNRSLNDIIIRSNMVAVQLLKCLHLMEGFFLCTRRTSINCSLK